MLRPNVRSGSFSTEMGCLRHVRSTPAGDRTAEMASGPFRAPEAEVGGKNYRETLLCSCRIGVVQPAVFVQAARSKSTIKSRVIGTASRLVDSSN